MTTKEHVLLTLESMKGKRISGEQLAVKLGVTRGAVWKAIKLLKEDGYSIDGISNRGYCLSRDSDIMSKESIAAALHGTHELHFFPSMESTNSYAKELAENGAPHGTAVVALEQSGGRGRQGREFVSPRGGIYLSVILKTQFTAESSVNVTTAAAVRICKVLEELCNIKPQIKWVNDIFLNGKKIGGILTEATIDLELQAPRYVVVGAGVNLYEPEGGFPPELANIARSIYERGSSPTAKSKIIAAIIDTLSDRNIASEEHLDEYAERCPIVSKQISFMLEGEEQTGTVLGFAERCGLIVKLIDGKTITLSYGEVRIAGTYL